ncbi:MAG: DUF3108 domain-containing protein [Bacteroidia bacterium]
MKKILPFTSLLFLLLSLVAWKPVGSENTPPQIRAVKNVAFQTGEFLKYRVHYGVITAGYATLQVDNKLTDINGRKCYHIVGKGYTTSSYDWVYKIRDRYETYLDQEALLPWRFVRHIEEGDFRSHTETRFNHQQKKVVFVDEKNSVSIYNVPENIQDVISCYYFARTLNRSTLKAGQRIAMTNFLDRKTVPLQAEFLKRETISVEGKKYKALKMKLLIEESGLVTDKSKINFWVSDDENKVPLRIEAELAIGSIKIDLMETQNLKNDFLAVVP